MTSNCRSEKGHSIILSAACQHKFQRVFLKKKKGRKKERKKIKDRSAILNTNISNKFPHSLHSRLKFCMN